MIRRRLLAWYDRNKRDLPWRRRADDPYAQWVAEIMLQQTRVETVLAYYERFLRRFPDVLRLARADHDDVLKHWEGLGYYRRVLHLHEAAKTLARRKEPVPESVEQLRELPGVGNYTAAAIASIAFGRPVAAVDGNVVRVVSRLFAQDLTTTAAPLRKQIEAIAQALVSPSRPGDFNQAWMDLGSAVCVPGAPRCGECPLRTQCDTARNGIAERQVRRTGRASTNPVVHVVVGIFRRGDRFLVRRRPRGGLWSGLWEFPNVAVQDAKSSAHEVCDLADSEGLGRLGTARAVGNLRHDLTHRRMMFRVYAVKACGGSGRVGSDGQPRQWVTAREFGRLSVSTAHRKIFALASGRA